MSQSQITTFFSRNPSQQLTPDQKKRIEDNRQKAQDRLRASQQKKRSRTPSSFFTKGRFSSPSSSPPASSSAGVSKSASKAASSSSSGSNSKFFNDKSNTSQPSPSAPASHTSESDDVSSPPLKRSRTNDTEAPAQTPSPNSLGEGKENKNKKYVNTLSSSAHKSKRTAAPLSVKKSAQKAAVSASSSNKPRRSAKKRVKRLVFDDDDDDEDFECKDDDEDFVMNDDEDEDEDDDHPDVVPEGDSALSSSRKSIAIDDEDDDMDDDDDGFIVKKKSASSSKRKKTKSAAPSNSSSSPTNATSSSSSNSSSTSSSSTSSSSFFANPPRKPSHTTKGLDSFDFASPAVIDEDTKSEVAASSSSRPKPHFDPGFIPGEELPTDGRTVPISMHANQTPRGKERAANKRMSDSLPKSAGGTKRKRTGNAGKNYMDHDWMKNPRDKAGRKKGDPDYNPTQIKVPANMWEKFTPSVRRFWEIKQNYWDCIIFYKVGKFYEVYDEDAIKCHRELGLNFMGGDERPHVGCPETSYEKYAEQLIARGLKVAKVDQVETKAAMEARCKKHRGTPKVVKRALTTVVTPGANVDPAMNRSPDAAFILSIAEEPSEEAKEPSFGVTFVDSASSNFFVGRFSDDRHRTRLRTLLCQIRPVEVVYGRDSLRGETLKTLSHFLPSSTIHNKLQPITEFWGKDDTISQLNKHRYFVQDKDAPLGDKELLDAWPAALSEHSDDELVMSSLGGCVWYLRRLVLAEELLSLKQFQSYDPADKRQNEFLVLDGSTLTNLEILVDSDGSSRASLFKWIDHCLTPFGHRLLREWIQRPLCRTKHIEARLDAIDDLMSNEDVASEAQELLRTLPDIERLMSRIHAHTLDDKGIVMYENMDIRRIKMFVSTMEGLRACAKVVQLFEKVFEDLSAPRLRFLVGDGFPNIDAELEECSSAFDVNKALKAGRVIPKPGVCPEYDEACDELHVIDKEFEKILDSTKRTFRDPKVKYYHTTAFPYQLEIDRAVTKKYVKQRGSLPVQFEEATSTSKKQRFQTPEILALNKRKKAAMDAKEAQQKDLLKMVFSRFCAHNEKWQQVIRCISELDCLLALHRVSAYSPGTMCRPRFVDPDSTPTKQPVLDLVGAWHPCVTPSVNLTGASEFIPNDVTIGADAQPAPFVLVTGPNMGGKSTLLRQTCIAVILAQLGCYVPAQSCTLSPVDRIFTRIGASDAIMANRSTFYVELEETSNILRHATRDSLVILDELGRGTSTFDGTSIAFAVTEHLSKLVLCRTLFSTHYHVLSDEYALSGARVALFHMACEVRDDKSITFLYKFIRGSCPKSHGMHCAGLAGLPRALIDRASEMSDGFEAELKRAHGASSSSNVKLKLASRVMDLVRSGGGVSALRSALSSLQVSSDS